MADLTYGSRIAWNYREMPWTRLGKPIQDDCTVEEAFEIAMAYYEIYLAEANAYQIIGHDGEYTQQYVSGDQLDQKSNGIAVLRAPSYDDPNWAVLGKASQRFAIIQPRDLAKMIEGFRQFGRVETVGVLEEGARIFASFAGQEWDVRKPGDKRDPQKSYMVVKDTYLPGECLQFQLTTVRPVCKNTWLAGDAQALLNIPLSHFNDIHLIAKWVADALLKVPDAIKKQQATAERMVRTSVSDKIVKQGIDFSIPMPSNNKVVQGLKGIENMPGLEKVLVEAQGLIDRKDTQNTVMQERINRQREAAWRCYQESETVDRGTAWGGMNAITESVDWTVRTPSNLVQTKKSLLSSFWGEKLGWKERAYEFFSQPEKWEV